MNSYGVSNRDALRPNEGVRMKYGLFMVLIWCTVMAPLTLLMAAFHVPYAGGFWRFVGVM